MGPGPVTRFPPAVLAALGGLAVYAGVFAWAMSNTGYEVWGALIVVPLVIAANIPFLRWAARREPEEWFGPLLAAAFGVKILGSFARYWMVFELYGYGDATGYLGFAARQSELWRQGFFLFGEVQTAEGTHSLRLITTAVYTLTGPSPITAFVVFAIFSFWGQYLMYRAFRLALPDFDLRRYALLVFFLPSFLFWPSSVGKEAWLMLGLGVVALGAAKLYRQQAGGMPLLLAGLLSTAIVRPHITAIAVAGVLAGMMFRESGGRELGWLGKIAGIAALLAMTIAFADRAAEFIGVDEFSVTGVVEAVEDAGESTEQGGSQFTPVPFISPLGIPAAIVTVLFRPLPWEASSVQALATSLESLFLLGLIAVSWRRFRSLGEDFRNPYLVFSLVYALLFIWAFSRFGNFGIIARQRVLVLPFVLILASLPPVTSRSRDRKRSPHPERRRLASHV